MRPDPGPLARSQVASRRSCGRPTRSRCSVVFLGTRANAELVPIFHTALHASHAALPTVTSKLIAQFLSSARNEVHSLPNPLPFSLPRALPCLKRTSTRRPSRHCLGTFKAGTILYPPKCNVSYYPHPLSLSLSSWLRRLRSERLFQGHNMWKLDTAKDYLLISGMRHRVVWRSLKMFRINLLPSSSRSPIHTPAPVPLCQP
jgi:hypothetical protein